MAGPVALLVLDIDHFKLVNDSFGHDAGDEVLAEFAVRLATNVRAVDLPCRLGGEEFVVVMPGASLEDAQMVAERIRRDVASAPFRVMGGKEQLTITISIGVAATPARATRPKPAEASRRGGLRGQGQRPEQGRRQGGLTGRRYASHLTPDKKRPADDQPGVSYSSADQVTYLILPSLKSTCLRTTGSYFLTTIFSVMVRAFFLVT
jgi:hypothetical protein